MTTTINQPSQIPNPVQQGYSIQHVSPLQRSQLVSGRARQRRIFTSVPSMVTVSWFFETVSQCQLFELFYRVTLKDGAEWFNARLETPIGFKQYECRFADIYSLELESGRYWIASAQLEIIERQTLPDSLAEFPDYVVMAAIIDIAINQKWPEA